MSLESTASAWLLSRAGDDAFGAREFEGRRECFAVGDGFYLMRPAVMEMGKEGADAGVVQTGGNGIGFGHFALRIFNHKGATAVQHIGSADGESSGRFSTLRAVAARFSEDNVHTFVVQIMIDGTCGVRAAADAGNEVVGVVASSFRATAL